MKNLKANLLVTPVSILIGGIVVLVLVLTKQAWSYYLIGLMVGLLNHGLFIKSSSKIANMIELDPKCEKFNPKKETRMNYLLRMAIFVVIFIALTIKADVKNNKEGLFWCLLTGLGYLTHRFTFLVCLVIFKDKAVVKNE